MSPFTFRFSDQTTANAREENWAPREASELRDFQVDAVWSMARHVPFFKHGTSHFTVSARMIRTAGHEQLVQDRIEVTSHINGFCSQAHYRTGIERALLHGLLPRWGDNWTSRIKQQLAKS